MERLVPKLRFPGFDENWKERKLGDVTIWASGGTPSKDNSSYWNGDIPWISASSMRGTEYSDADQKITVEGAKKGSKLAKRDSLLLLVRGSMLFKTIPVGIVSRDVAFNQDVKSIVVNKESTSKFLLYWFLHSEPLLLSMVTGTGIGAGKLDLPDLKLMQIGLPSLPEQTKIAEFLTAIDKRIELLTAKKEKLTLYKKGVMQKIFNQEIRFKPDDGGEFPEWTPCYAGDLFASITNKRHNSDLPILAITQEHGAIPRNLIDYNISVSEKSVDSYKVVEKGDFIISLRSFQGGIEYSNYLGICSPAYIILKPKVAIVDQWFKYFFKTDSYIVQLNEKLEGIRDGKMISYKYFSETKINLPSVQEQSKISEFILSIDAQIQKVEQQITLNQTYKKGLLQQMFV
jgi:type I restriction enzyme S subunit